jgi:hypothetical protein
MRGGVNLVCFYTRNATRGRAGTYPLLNGKINKTYKKTINHTPFERKRGRQDRSEYEQKTRDTLVFAAPKVQWIILTFIGKEIVKCAK